MSYVHEMQSNVQEIIREKGILEQSTWFQQFPKFEEELEELYEAADSQDSEKIMDEMGDVLFCALVQCIMLQVDAEAALEHACRKVQARKGKMIDGIWVKEADL